MYVKHLTQHLAHHKHAMNNSYISKATVVLRRLHLFTSVGHMGVDGTGGSQSPEQ